LTTIREKLVGWIPLCDQTSEIR